MNDQGKVVLIYDGDCDFCRWCVVRWGHITKDRVQYIPYGINQTHFLQCGELASVRLLELDGKVYAGAEAVFRVLAHAPRCGGFLWMYRHVPAFKPLAEWGYRCVAACRGILSSLIRYF